LEYRTENVKTTQLFDLETDPLELNNFFDIDGYQDIVARMRGRLFELRDEWDDESHKFGKVFWDAWRDYEDAVVPNPDGPSGRNRSPRAVVTA
jgi:hypothetical protein